MKINSINNQNFGAYFVTLKYGEPYKDVYARYVKGVDPYMMERLEKEGLVDEFKAAEAELAELPDVPLCIDNSIGSIHGSAYYLEGLSEYGIFTEKIAKYNLPEQHSVGQQFVDSIKNICNGRGVEHEEFMEYAQNADMQCTYEQFNEELESSGFVNT
ncbi:MAG: hypothetical protein LBK53_06020 [Heliobacteriaceae bacterium]|jgi:hypothetical protein|nr:hypothetical protein [Heliobacteriaceae bacterium]